MALPLIVIFCLCGVFCLAPLSLYLAWLGAINRRPHPTVIGSSWDFVGLLAGLSGFLVFGGGILIAALQSNFRLAARGNWEQLQAAWGQDRYAWGALALGYLLTLAGGVTLVLLARARSLSVYNLDRAQAEQIIADVLARLGVAATRFGNVWSDTLHGRPVVSIDSFTGLRHVTIKLPSVDPRLAEELERALRAQLVVTPVPESGVAGWLYSAAIACFVTTVCCTLLVAYFLYLNT